MARLATALALLFCALPASAGFLTSSDKWEQWWTKVTVRVPDVPLNAAFTAADITLGNVALGNRVAAATPLTSGAHVGAIEWAVNVTDLGADINMTLAVLGNKGEPQHLKLQGAILEIAMALNSYSVSTLKVSVVPQRRISFHDTWRRHSIARVGVPVVRRSHATLARGLTLAPAPSLASSRYHVSVCSARSRRRAPTRQSRCCCR